MRPRMRFLVAGFIATISMHSMTAVHAQMDAIPPDTVSWHLDLNRAREIAKQDNRPLLVHFWTPNCVPCKRLDRNVFNRKSVSETLHDFFVPVKINAASSPDIAARFKVDRFPTDVIVTPNGEELHRMISPQSPQQYVSQLSAIAFRSGIVPRKKADTRLNRNQDFAAQHQVASHSQPNRNDERISQQRETLNPYLNQNDPIQRYTTEDQNETKVARDSYTGRNPYVEQETTPAPQGNRAYIGNVHYGESTYPPNGAVTPITKPSSPQKRIGMDGYCPVTLLKKDAWKKGDPRFGVVHRGQTYMFVGRAEKDLFLAKPDEYSPVLAGIDPVDLVANGKVIQGNRAHGVVFQKRVYLFSNEQNLETFWNTPERFTEPVQQAMFGRRTIR